MSIIYEALKKVEDSFVKDQAPDNSPPVIKKKITYREYLLYLAGAVAGVIIIRLSFVLFFGGTKPAAPKDLPATALPAPAAVVTAVPVTSPSSLPVQAVPGVAPSTSSAVKHPDLVLNGIFFSQDESSYALINNQIVRQGDLIEGATVMRINPDTVELKAADSSEVKLSTVHR